MLIFVPYKIISSMTVEAKNISKEEFQKLILQGIPDELPPYKPL